MNLLDIYEGREPYQQAIDKLEKARIDHLKEKMDYYAKHRMVKDFQKAKEEYEEIHKIKSEAGIPGNVPVEKIPGKEDLLKGRGRSYYEAEESEWTKEGPWTKTPKNKTGRPVDPRGEVAHLSDVARREAERKAQDQKKNPKEVDEHGGGIGPRQHWQDLMQERKLSVGDPIVVTAPNEFEGKTGEIHELSPSGKFVIVNLYNHGKHSMHLSDIEYNQYADDQEQDDWYDEEMEEGYAATIGPDVAPLPPEKQWRIQVRQLIADYIKNPQGLYNIAKRKGPNSAEAMAYKFIMHPKGKIDLPPDAVTFEGYQDFNRVEPYAVCLAGKPVKKFDYYEDARRFHDNWKKKLYREGDKAKADTITLMPLNLDEAVEDYAGIYSPEAIALGKRFCDHYNITDDGDIQLAVEIIDSYLNEFKASNTPVDLKKIKSGVADAFRQVYRGMGPGPTFRKKFQDQGVTEDTGSWIVFDPTTKQIKKRFKTHTAGKSYAKTHGLGFASSEYYFDNIKDQKALAELDVNTLKSYADKRGAQVAAMKADNPDAPAGSPEWIKAAVPGIQVARAKQKIARKERQQGVAETALNPQDLKGDLAAKRKALQDLSMNKDVDQQAVQQRRLDLDREAKDKGIAEGAMSNLHAELSDVYNRMAPGIERNRDSFKAGQLYDALEAVAEQHGAEAEFKRMMAGARNRAHMDYDTNPGGFHNWFWYLPFAEEELSEEQDTSAVERAILNRIMVAHTDLLMKFGPEKVMQAAEEVAYNVGEVDEIGTSDVSAYVHQVKQILGVPEEVNEKWSQKYKSSINCANPKGFSQKAHCAGRKK